MPILVTYPNTVIQVAKPDKLVVVHTEHRIVRIQQGPPGPKGDTGPQGPPGETAVEVLQTAPSTVWTIVHNMGHRPAGYTIYDSADTIYEAGVEYIDDDTMQFSFSAAISGRVVLV